MEYGNIRELIRWFRDYPEASKYILRNHIYALDAVQREDILSQLYSEPYH